MHTLYLLRHAKSSWDDPTLADYERPLAPRGRRAAKRIGDYLRAGGIEPEFILCSGAERTRQTLQLIELASPTMIDPLLYASSAEQLLDRVRAVPDDVASVMLIGHNPALHDLALGLASAGAELELLAAKFPTAGLATLTTRTTWTQLTPGEAVLAGYVVPKQLPDG